MYDKFHQKWERDQFLVKVRIYKSNIKSYTFIKDLANDLDYFIASLYGNPNPYCSKECLELLIKQNALLKTAICISKGFEEDFSI